MTWFPMNWWRRTLRQMVKKGTVGEWSSVLGWGDFMFVLSEDVHTTFIQSIIPGSVWWSQEQQSTSHHACISSALDPLLRTEQCHCHSENLWKKTQLWWLRRTSSLSNFTLKRLSHLGWFHLPAPLSHCHHPGSRPSPSLCPLSGWIVRQL